MPRLIYQKKVAIGGIYWISQNNGFIYGQTTGLINALQKNDEGIILSENEISLIASLFIIINLVGYSSAGAIADRIGRRWSFISFSVLLTIYSIILYISRTMPMFILSKSIGGIGFGGIQSLTISITSEYTSPKTRALFLNMITTVAPAIGTGVAHFLGTILHWRSLALVSALFSGFGIILPYYWVESPHWLASRGMFEECEQSFRKLHGKKSDKELHRLIKLEQSKIDAVKEMNAGNTLKRLRLALKKRYFWELIVFSIFMYVYMAAAGKLVFSTLATVMLEEMTGTSDVILFTLLVDSFVFFGSLLSCVLIRKTSMRTLLFSTGFAGNVVLLILGGCLYFKRDEVYFKWIIVSLLALYFIIVNAGPYPVLEVLMSEIFPIDVKLYCIFFSGITLAVFFFLSVILYPVIVGSVGYPGMFLLNVVLTSLSLAYMWLRLPETKGRTLQEIEVYFKTKDFDVDKALNNVQMKSLI